MDNIRFWFDPSVGMLFVYHAPGQRRVYLQHLTDDETPYQQRGTEPCIELVERCDSTS